MAKVAKGTSFTQLQAAAAAREQRAALPWRMTLIALLAIVAAGAFAYSNSLTGPFVFDDENAIQTNATIRQLWPIRPVLTPPRDGTLGGRPIVNLSFAINYA